MSADSKKREELLKQITQKVKGGMNMTLLERITSFINKPKDFDLIERAATLPSDKVPEAENFILCFKYLNWNECVFDQFDPTKGRAFVRLLKNISDCEVKDAVSSGIIRDNVDNTAPYTSLFTNLSPDTEMKESELPDGARIFFFIVGKKFNIVSVETRHRNIDR